MTEFNGVPRVRVGKSPARPRKPKARYYVAKLGGMWRVVDRTTQYVETYDYRFEAIDRAKQLKETT